MTRAGPLGSDDGQVLPLVLGMAVVAFSVAGLAVDGTRAFLYRRTLQNAADAAALAAAGEIDVEAYHVHGEVALDPAAARSTALRWLRRRELEIAPSIAAAEDGVDVVVRGRVPTTFLRLIGITDLAVAAEAHSEPVPGAPP